MKKNDKKPCCKNCKCASSMSMEYIDAFDKEFILTEMILLGKKGHKVRRITYV
jgi:hypothetical protein